MLYWKYSTNRVFFINEYWIFVPTAILVNYVIFRKNRIGKEKIKRLAEQIEHQKKIKRILLLSLGLTGCVPLLTRGGSSEDIIDTDYIKLLCKIDEGINFLDNNRLRQIIFDLYKHKRKGRLIYITATALCHVANRYGQLFLTLPFAIGDFGLTNVYQSLRKGLVSILLGAVGPLLVVGSPLALMTAFMLCTFGLRLAFNNLDYILTTPINVGKNLKPRVPGMNEVIVINNRAKISMSKTVQENYECWLAEQRLLNPTCKIKDTQIADAIDASLPDLRYDNVVNMQDVTGLDRIQFSDKFDLGEAKPSIKQSPIGKQVNFLDKFGDSDRINENQGWNTYENEFMAAEKKYLRTRNKP